VCGIAGIVTPGVPARREVLARMVGAMTHRGPDGESLWAEEDVALGMRRLAIVDVEGGAQPLCDEARTVHVVFNGEIYNHEELRAELQERGHRFRSRTDGEVIPHLYEELGPEFARRLNGIFAIALWDEQSCTLLLVRDQLGVKPLYLHQTGSELRFASEIKALLQDPAVPRQLDPVALDEHLTYRFTPAPRTLIAGVEKLEPATVLVWREGTANKQRYWNPRPAIRQDMSFDDAAEGLREHLRTSVHRQMMSDRPIGVMLSGGVDSAAVVALMAERSSQIKTFTVGFEGGGDADETGLARETAELFGTEHHELILGHGDFAAELPAVIEMLEEPVGTSSALGFRQISRLAREHVPVLLSGQGADELLAGYWRYVGEWIAGIALRLPRPLPSVLAPLARTSDRVRSARLERGLRALRYPDVLERFMNIYAVFTEEQKRGLYGPELTAQCLANGHSAAAERVEQLRREIPDRDSLNQMMYVDTRLWLPDDLLLVGDKMSMAESVEMRVPFLDPGLVEFVESLPSSYKIRRGQRKAVEKAALAPMLPLKIVHRKERGFVTPVDRWLRTDMRGFARELLLADDAFCSQLFSMVAVRSLLSRHQAGEFDHTRQIFCLLSFELWARRFLRA
jgi:asparagine synthase (glutamine-hydrolysing)